MNATFREVERKDVSALLEMMRDLYTHDAVPFDEEKSRNGTFQLISSMDTAVTDLGRIWMIETDGVLAGYLVLTFGFSLEYGGPHGFIDELFVKDEFRGKGLGALAVEHASKLCQSLGMKVILLEVAFENSRAHTLYERIGFREHGRRLMSKSTD